MDSKTMGPNYGLKLKGLNHGPKSKTDILDTNYGPKSWAQSMASNHGPNLRTKITDPNRSESRAQIMDPNNDPTYGPKSWT